MAGNLIMGVDVAQAPQSGKSRARLVFRGRHRKMIKKLLYYGQAVQRQDEESDRKGTANGYQGAQLVGSRGSADDKALKRIIARCKEALAQKG